MEKFKFTQSYFLLMQMDEEEIVKELKELKKKLFHIQIINKTTNFLLAIILIMIFLISAYNGFRWV